MDQLKDEIKDVKARKKHILENMLYMSELNKKNVLVCNQIFNINNELKLNIYEGDSLKVDYNNEFGIKHFDIIMGNPPYQKKVGTKRILPNIKNISDGVEIYHKFYCIKNENKYGVLAIYMKKIK